MDVRFISVLSDRLHTVPVIEGQVIALSDRDEYYYDLGGERRTASGQKCVKGLPKTGQPNMLYIVNTGDVLTTGCYAWDSENEEFVCMASPNVNTEVTSTPSSENVKAYIVGTTEPDTTTGELVKDTDIFYNPYTGEITAKGFLGNATSSTSATKDNLGQIISSTYIKGLSISDRVITYTRGDGSSAKFTVGGVATSTRLGLVKSGTDISVDDEGNVSVLDNSHNHKVSNISDLTASATELNYMKGVNKGVQGQLNTKAPLNSPALTGVPTAPTAEAGTNTTQLATTAFVQSTMTSGISGSGAIILKGKLGASADGGSVTTLPKTHEVGWAYKVVTAGTYAGKPCEVGDFIVAIVRRTGTGNTDDDWSVLQGNIDGAITSAVSGDNFINVSRDSSKITIAHKDVSSTTNTDIVSVVPGDAIHPVTKVVVDKKGHLTNVVTSEIRLPKYTASKGIQLGANLNFEHTNSVAAGTAKGDDTKKLNFGETFRIPTVNYDEHGHITGSGTTVMTMPNNPNTHYISQLIVGGSSAATANAAATNGNVYLNMLDDSTIRNAHKISGSGATTVTSDANGNITVSSVNTTYNDMVGATTSAAGTHGLVPAPPKISTLSTDVKSLVLLNTGSWAPLSDRYVYSVKYGLLSSESSIVDSTPQLLSTTLQQFASRIIALGGAASNATVTAAGLMSPEDKIKLNNIADNANAYVHPTYTALTGEPTTNATPGFGGSFNVSQVVSDSTGHVKSLTSRTVTIPSTVATESTNGLMSAEMVTKLKGISSGANSYVHPNYTPRTNGLYKITVDSLGHISNVVAVTKSDITNLGIPGSDTKYSTATSTQLGLVKIGFATSGKNYPVELNDSGQMFVNVPWTDNNTTYSVFGKSGPTASVGLVPAPSTTAGTTKYLREDGTWAVPPDTNTTYTLSSFGITATANELNHMSGVTSNVQTQINNLGKSVADGKTLLAASISDVWRSNPVASDATFEELNTALNSNVSAYGVAKNQEGYSSGYSAGVTATKVGTATAAQVLAGHTFTNASSVGASGTMANQGAVSQRLDCGVSYTIPAGYHNGSGTVIANSLSSQTSATATAAQILSGKTGWVNGTKITGTMTDYSSNIQTVNSGSNSGTTTIDIPNGYHTYIKVNNANAYNAGYAAAGTDAYDNGYTDGYNDGYAEGYEIASSHAAVSKIATFTAAARYESRAEIGAELGSYDYWTVYVEASLNCDVNQCYNADQFKSWEYDIGNTAVRSVSYGLTQDTSKTVYKLNTTFGDTYVAIDIYNYTVYELYLDVTIVAWNAVPPSSASASIGQVTPSIGSYSITSSGTILA